MEPLIIYPNSKEDVSLYKQMAKRLNNRLLSTKAKKLDTEIKKQKFLDEFSESLQEVKLHEAGKITLKTARELYNEL